MKPNDPHFLVPDREYHWCDEMELPKEGMTPVGKYSRVNKIVLLHNSYDGGDNLGTLEIIDGRLVIKISASKEDVPIRIIRTTEEEA